MDNARVVDADVYPIATCRRTRTVSVQLIIRLRTDEGIVDWGEASDLDRYWMVMADVTTLRDAVRRLTVGYDPAQLLALHERMAALLLDYRHCARTYPLFTLESQLAAAIDIAGYDIVGERCEVSIADLLGGRVRDTIDVAYPIFTVDDDAGAEQARQLIDECLISGLRTSRYYSGTELDTARQFLESLAEDYRNRIVVKSSRQRRSSSPVASCTSRQGPGSVSTWTSGCSSSSLRTSRCGIDRRTSRTRYRGDP